MLMLRGVRSFVPGASLYHPGGVLVATTSNVTLNGLLTIGTRRGRVACEGIHPHWHNRCPTTFMQHCARLPTDFRIRSGNSKRPSAPKLSPACDLDPCHPVAFSHNPRHFISGLPYSDREAPRRPRSTTSLEMGIRHLSCCRDIPVSCLVSQYSPPCQKHQCVDLPGHVRTG